MPGMGDVTVAILATDGYEKAELFHPKRALEDAGATVVVISPDNDSIRSWDGGDWGESVPVDLTLEGARVADFDALVLPGGQINPDLLRTNARAVAFVRDFFESGKTLAAICHAPWLLVEAGVLKNREVTSYPSIRTDVENAGARWKDAEVVVDSALVTSRDPGDLDAFVAKIIEEIGEGRHHRTAA